MSELMAPENRSYPTYSSYGSPDCSQSIPKNRREKSGYGLGLALVAAAGEPAGGTEAEVADCGATGAELAGEVAVAADAAIAGEVPGAIELPGLAGAGETCVAGPVFFNSRLSVLPPMLRWA